MIDFETKHVTFCFPTKLQPSKDALKIRGFTVTFLLASKLHQHTFYCLSSKFRLLGVLCMIVYDIKLYDPKTDKVTVVLTLTERRQDPNRPRGSMTIEKRAKSLFGKEWWSKNWHNISITERYVHHRANGGRDGDSKSTEKCFFIIER